MTPAGSPPPLASRPAVSRLRQVGKGELRKIPVPANRYTPLKENWMKIFTPIVEHLQLQIRFNLKTRNVEIKVRGATSPAFPGNWKRKLCADLKALFNI